MRIRNFWKRRHNWCLNIPRCLATIASIACLVLTVSIFLLSWYIIINVWMRGMYRRANKTRIIERHARLFLLVMTVVCHACDRQIIVLVAINVRLTARRVLIFPRSCVVSTGSWSNWNKEHCKSHKSYELQATSYKLWVTALCLWAKNHLSGYHTERYL